MSETDRNKQAIRDLMAAADAGDLDTVMGFYARSYFDHDASESRAHPDSHYDAVRSAFERFRRWFPDTRHTIEDLIAEGDRVTARITAEATHDHEAFGMAPSGRTVRSESIAIYRFEDGRIVERWCREEHSTREAVAKVAAP